MVLCSVYWKDLFLFKPIFNLFFYSEQSSVKCATNTENGTIKLCLFLSEKWLHNGHLLLEYWYPKKGNEEWDFKTQKHASMKILLYQISEYQIQLLCLECYRNQMDRYSKQGLSSNWRGWHIISIMLEFTQLRHNFWDSEILRLQLKNMWIYQA